MPIIRLNAHGTEYRVHGSTQSPNGLLHGQSSSDSPVVVMIHGYSYEPGHEIHCPHKHILSLDPQPLPWLAPSWPLAVGVGTDGDDAGLGIAFGWFARGTLWRAKRRAIEAGQALAKALTLIRRIAPQRKIHILAHSMGAEVVAEALHHMPSHTVDRIISMTGACYRTRMENALETEAGRTARFINITSRENDLFDFFFESLIAPPRRGDRSIGSGLNCANAVTLQLDCAETLDHLTRLGANVSPPAHRVCHWSSYLRPGVLEFYADLIHRADHLTIDRLRAGIPATPAPRWSRLCPQPGVFLPVSFAQKAS